MLSRLTSKYNEFLAGARKCPFTRKIFAPMYVMVPAEEIAALDRKFAMLGNYRFYAFKNDEPRTAAIHCIGLPLILLTGQPSTSHEFVGLSLLWLFFYWCGNVSCGGYISLRYGEANPFFRGSKVTFVKSPGKIGDLRLAQNALRPEIWTVGKSKLVREKGYFYLHGNPGRSVKFADKKLSADSVHLSPEEAADFLGDPAAAPVLRELCV